MTVGRGSDNGADVGPLIDAAQRDKVAELVEDATGRVRRASPAAPRATAAATSMSPRSLADIPDDAKVLTRGDLRPGRADHDVQLGRGGDRGGEATEYGLVSYVYTSDLDARAARLRERSRAG